MRHLVILFLVQGVLMAAPGDKELEYIELLRGITRNPPNDKQSLYLKMTFAQIPAPILFDAKALAALSSWLEKKSPAEFKETFLADAHYRDWILEVLRLYKIYNETRDDELFRLASFMEEGSIKIVDALNNRDVREIIFLIQYCSRNLDPGQELTRFKDRPNIKVAQLLEVMRAEQGKLMAKFRKMDL